MHPTLDPLGFFPAVMAKIRCILEEEEKLHWERIHAKLSEVISETYLNFGSQINKDSTDDIPDTLICPARPSVGTIDNGSGMSSITQPPFATPITRPEASSNVVSLPGRQAMIGSPEDSQGSLTRYQRPCLPVLNENTSALFEDLSNERWP
jgi:hypothetical protein